jgi:hypothetical protein
MSRSSFGYHKGKRWNRAGAVSHVAFRAKPRKMALRSTMP